MSCIRQIQGVKNFQVSFSQVRYELGPIVPDESVIVIVQFMNENNQIVYTQSLLVDGEDYKSWQNDMEFFDLIDSKLGINSS